VLLSVDSLACQHLSCYGYGQTTSPNIDKLAQSGVLFENVIAQSNWTKPALASILTSLYPSVHKTDAQGESGDRVDVEVRNRAHVLDARFRTIAEEFKDGNYATAAVSNGGYAHSFFGFGRGFDLYDNRGGRLKSCMYRLLSWVLRSADAPFMGWIHAWDAHFPYMDRPPYNRKFVAHSSPIVLDASVRHEINSGARHVTPVELAFLHGLYDGAISYVDELIGCFVRELQRLKLFDNTIFVITADHGEAFMEHGFMEHTACLHGEVLRVPLIVCGPGLDKGKRIKAQVRSIDIMPTLLDLCGIAPQNEIFGVSLLPWMRGRASHDLLAASETERGGGQTALSDGHYKIIRQNRENRFQLYDIAADRAERNDLAATSPEILCAMKSKLGTWEHDITSCADRYWSDESRAEAPEMGSEVVERLRDLGYVE
jgi:arylsulfatase A-like enzyme